MCNSESLNNTCAGNNIETEDCRIGVIILCFVLEFPKLSKKIVVFYCVLFSKLLWFYLMRMLLFFILEKPWKSIVGYHRTSFEALCSVSLSYVCNNPSRENLIS